MSSIDNMGSLLSAAGVGALLSKGLDWVLERRRKRDSDDEARSVAEITDRAALTAELWKKLSEIEKLYRETQLELDKMRAMNAEVTARLLSTQAELEALHKQNEAQQKEIEALQRTLGRVAATETDKHPAAS